MAIEGTDFELRLSGGAANSDVNASLGGAKSSVSLTSGALHNLFDQVSEDESESGDVEYRCIYIHNANATDTAYNTKVYIKTQASNASVNVQIGLGSSAVDAEEQSISDEDDAAGDLTGVTFDDADGVDNALTIGNLAAGEHKAVWLARAVTADAAAMDLDNIILTIRAGTAE